MEYTSQVSFYDFLKDLMFDANTMDNFINWLKYSFFNHFYLRSNKVNLETSKKEHFNLYMTEAFTLEDKFRHGVDCSPFHPKSTMADPYMKKMTSKSGNIIITPRPTKGVPIKAYYDISFYVKFAPINHIRDFLYKVAEETIIQLEEEPNRMLEFICHGVDVPCLHWKIVLAKEKSKSKDVYKLLELTKDSTSSDLKKAFYRLSRIHHPDRGGDAEMCKQISHAYEILKDTQMRERYDRYGKENPEEFDYDETNDDYNTSQKKSFTKSPKKTPKNKSPKKTPKKKPKKTPKKKPAKKSPKKKSSKKTPKKKPLKKIPKKSAKKPTKKSPTTDLKKKQTSKRYLDRKSPPYKAAGFKNKSKKGNDGRMYTSKSNINGVYRWVVKK